MPVDALEKQVAMTFAHAEFWAGKSVLVTGHMGFKGGWLSLCLNHLGARVTGFCDKPPSKPNIFECAAIAQGIRSVVGDVRDLDAVCRVVRESAPDVVFHLAAQSLVRESYRNPVRTFESNVLGTVNVLEAVRLNSSARAALMVTSDKCYENKEWHWGYREADAVGGHDPYSASKGAAEIVTASYRRSFFSERGDGRPNTAIASVRAGNVIGGGDWGVEKLIPDIVRALVRGESPVIRNPAALRPWQHVLDALFGYMLLAQRLWDDPSVADAWNFGPNDSDTRDVRWIVERMVAMWGSNLSWTQDAREAPHEARLLKLDSSKARNVLHWAPKLDLESALAWTVNWYRQQTEGADMRQATIAQIDTFLGRAAAS